MDSNTKKKWCKAPPVPARLTIFTEPYQCAISTSSSMAINLSRPDPSQNKPQRGANLQSDCRKTPRDSFHFCALRCIPPFLRQKFAGFVSAIPLCFHCSFLENLPQTSPFSDAFQSHQILKPALAAWLLTSDGAWRRALRWDFQEEDTFNRYFLFIGVFWCNFCCCYMALLPKSFE